MSLELRVSSLGVMVVEWARLALGIAVAVFHQPIADFIMQQERALWIVLRERGVALPALPSQSTARNVYFALGVLIAVFEIARIGLALLAHS